MAGMDRRQVLAYRVAAHGLDRTTSAAGVLAIGVPDTGPDAARLALAARLPDVPPVDHFGPGRPLALVWSWRASPHVHRRADLPALATATWPLSEADAVARLGDAGRALRRSQRSALAAWSDVVDVAASIVTSPTTKGALSGAATARVAPELTKDCRGCGAVHISDSALRPATLWAGLELEPGTNPPVLVPGFAPSGARRDMLHDVLQDVLHDVLHVIGPASVADVGAFLDIRRPDLQAIWPADLVAVAPDRWLPAADVTTFESPRAPDVVRLLAPFDPWLQQRDRALLVPEPLLRKRLWGVIGRPGAVLVDGEVVGRWRARKAGRRLAVTVEPFGGLADQVREQVVVEAQRVAVVRGLPSAVVEVTA